MKTKFLHIAPLEGQVLSEPSVQKEGVQGYCSNKQHEKMCLFF